MTLVIQVTAYRDTNGGLHATEAEAVEASKKAQFEVLFNQLYVKLGGQGGNSVTTTRLQRLHWWRENAALIRSILNLAEAG